MKSFLLESISVETTHHTSENTAILLGDVMKEYGLKKVKNLVFTSDWAANMKKAIKTCLNL